MLACLGYCMQDVCISFWKDDGTSDMMLKVTDICSTDPSDPTYCASPADIKIDRAKAAIMEGHQGNPKAPEVSGDQYGEKVWWFFMKCWADVCCPCMPDKHIKCCDGNVKLSS